MLKHENGGDKGWTTSVRMGRLNRVVAQAVDSERLGRAEGVTQERSGVGMESNAHDR